MKHKKAAQDKGILELAYSASKKNRSSDGYLLSPLFDAAVFGMFIVLGIAYFTA